MYYTSARLLALDLAHTLTLCSSSYGLLIKCGMKCKTKASDVVLTDFLESLLLEFERRSGQPVAEFIEHTLLVCLVFGEKCHTEPKVSSGVIPRHSRN